MKRFDVTWFGKAGTFLLMFAFPASCSAASRHRAAHGCSRSAAWLLGIPGLVLSYYTAVAYIPPIRDGIRVGPTRPVTATAEGDRR